MYLDDDNKNECCGCTACDAVCPKKAIEMKPDSRGFKYPVINEDKCVNCAICRKVCVFSNQGGIINTPISAYAVHYKDDEIRKTSRSGGAFYLIAEAVINKSGVVYGAVFDDKLQVVHCCVSSIEHLHKLQGSKYVQSDLNNCFPEIEKQLKDGTLVLFSGTACQVAGLLKFVESRGCDSDLLYTCDIVCQGVPSPMVYKDYIKYLEKKHGKKLLKFNFRDKERIGWAAHEESYLF